jgi:1-acyl-sn-glycerol-3-phosphate acyltransferase
LTGVPEADGFRGVVSASQSVSWLLAQILKLRFAAETHAPSGLFERGPEECLILAPTHRSVLDPWLIIGALRYRQWRALMPVRTLATTTFSPPLKWFLPLIRFLYRLEGVVELPPKEADATLPEKVQGLLNVLLQGDVVAIFPEGGDWKQSASPVREFAPGVVYLQRRSNADIIPMASWLSERKWPRRRYVIEIGRRVRIPETLDLEAGAAWLRERTVELYERAKQKADNQ